MSSLSPVDQPVQINLNLQAIVIRENHEQRVIVSYHQHKKLLVRAQSSEQFHSRSIVAPNGYPVEHPK
jgi:hypothetical protein